MAFNSRKLTRWLILLGLAMTLGSMLLDQYYITSLERQLASKRAQVTQLNYVIEQEWLNSQARVQRAYLSQLMLINQTGTQQQPSELQQQQLKNYLNQLVKDLESKQDLSNVKKLSAYYPVLKQALLNFQDQSLQFINDRYFKRLELEKQITIENMMRSDWQKLALLLQVLGLILILSREIFR